MGGRGRLASTLVIVILVFGLGACGGGGGGDETGVVKATKDLRFDPDSISVRFNHEAIITFRNTDKNQTHSFTLPYVFTDADNFVSVDAKPGETKDVKFTVKDRPAAGYLTFYCRFHQADGMAGRIKLT